MSKTYYIYILANRKNGTLYTGVTNDLIIRVFEHKHKMNKGFSSQYDIHKLVYFEQSDSIEVAIKLENK